VSMLHFILMGFLGGLTYILVWAKKWGDLKKFTVFRRLLLGAIIGYVYSFLYSDWDFPNAVMSFVCGYMGTDFVEALVKRLKPKFMEDK